MEQHKRGGASATYQTTQGAGSLEQIRGNVARLQSHGVVGTSVERDGS